jgi:hypothetical protein
LRIEVELLGEMLDFASSMSFRDLESLNLRLMPRS